ncbi:hypothetical protein EV652_1154 [Kribbella steppae]|uniref:Uncharacterized protein n=1 Tax=Kribbella steppae TaxID=2512223 RepID=A0A4R2H418_9ACTN|nr:hypothetical protein [Kribbella steppae]TCO18460.1 hypothetical protein EV652_1154 [Kribbella steppae]
MGAALQGYLATSGILSIVGGVIGLFVFNSVATPAPNCIVRGSDVCLEALGLTFIPFILFTAALGGAIGLATQYIKSQRS